MNEIVVDVMDYSWLSREPLMDYSWLAVTEMIHNLIPCLLFLFHKERTYCFIIF